MSGSPPRLVSATGLPRARSSAASRLRCGASGPIISTFITATRTIRRSSEETLAALDSLVRAGKVRAIGASQISAARLEVVLQVKRGQRAPRPIRFSRPGIAWWSGRATKANWPPSPKGAASAF